MTDESSEDRNDQPVNPGVQRATIRRNLTDRLIARGVTPEAAKELAADVVASRTYVAADGSFRFLQKFGGAFHAHDHLDPYSGVVGEVVGGAPASALGRLPEDDAARARTVARMRAQY